MFKGFISHNRSPKEKKEKISKEEFEIVEQYNYNLQISKFVDLRIVEDANILIQAGLDKDESDNQGYVFIINGKKLQSLKNFEKFSQYFIRELDEKIDHKLILFINIILQFRKYSLIYLVGDDMLAGTFQKFREYLRILPNKYYDQIKGFYIYHTSLFLRSYLWFEGSKKAKFWKKKTIFMGDLNEIFDIPTFHKRWIDIIPDYIKEGVDLTNLMLLRSQSLAMNPPEQKINKRNIFETNLESYELNKNGIPLLLDHLISYFDQNPLRLQDQGIFRKAGSISEEFQLIMLLAENNYQSLHVINDPHLIASLIKKFFSAMPVPIFNFNLYNEITKELPKIKKENEIVYFIQSIVYSMDNLSQRVLMTILSFLDLVIQFEQVNEMGISNLGRVFAPCFLRPKEFSMQDLAYTGFIIQFTTVLIRQHNKIYPGKHYKLFITQSNIVQNFQDDKSDDSLELVLDKIDFLDIHKEQIDEGMENVIKYQTLMQSAIEENQKIDQVYDEFTIDSILTNFKEDKPLEMKSSKQIQEN